jgi:hypothetical protein
MMRLGTDHPLPDVRCINCGVILTGAFAVDADHKPEPGNISICADCGHIAMFADDLSMRELTAKEQIEIAGDMRILMAQRALASVRQQRK